MFYCLLLEKDLSDRLTLNISQLFKHLFLRGLISIALSLMLFASFKFKYLSKVLVCFLRSTVLVVILIFISLFYLYIDHSCFFYRVFIIICLDCSFIIIIYSIDIIYSTLGILWREDRISLRTISDLV